MISAFISTSYPGLFLSPRTGLHFLLLGLLLGTGTKILWSVADQHVSSNNPRNNWRMHFGSSSLLVSKVANPVLIIERLKSHVYGKREIQVEKFSKQKIS